MRAAVVALLGLGACVAGNPPAASFDPDRLGGSLVPPGCAAPLVTRPGAEAPALPGPVRGADPTVVQVHLGIVDDPRTSMAVVWRTADDVTTTGRVRFGAADALDRDAPGLHFSYVTEFGNGDVVRMHEAHLCGLDPDTVYSYQIESDAEHRSPVYTFRTAPDVAQTPDAEIAFAAVGDSRGGYAVWARMIDQMIARDVDLVVFSGDAVFFGQAQDEWDQFFTTAEPLFTRVPVVSVHGNHEVNAPNFYAQFAMPGDEENFGFDYGHAHQLVVNDSPEVLDDLTGKVPAFMAADLAAHATAPWLIVNHHRGLYSTGAGHGSDSTLRAAWGPVFDQAGVDLVLNGHDHDYERTKPLRGEAIQPTAADGTIYVVSGGAGAPLHANGASAWTETSASLHSATVVRVRAGQLGLEAFDDAGAPVDAFTIVRP